MISITLVYCGSVRARPCAHMSVSRVCITFHATVYALFSGSCLQVPSCERVANSLSVPAGALSSLSVEVVEYCLIALPIGFALQSARVVSYPAAVLDGQSSARPDLSSGRPRHEKAQPDLSSGSVLAGRVSVQAPLGIRCRKLPVKTPPPSCTLL